MTSHKTSFGPDFVPGGQNCDNTPRIFGTLKLAYSLFFQCTPNTLVTEYTHAWCAAKSRFVAWSRAQRLHLLSFCDGCAHEVANPWQQLYHWEIRVEERGDGGLIVPKLAQPIREVSKDESSASKQCSHLLRSGPLSCPP